MTRPRVMTVVSCGGSKQPLEDGETVPARELYDSSVHTCKDRYGQHSDGYYIMSAKYGLVHHSDELPYYDQKLDEMSDGEQRMWGANVASSIRQTVDRKAFNAVVLIGSKTYVGAIEPHFESIPADVLTPWQTDDYVTGVGRGMSWCNDPEHWPEDIERVEEIGEVVSRGDSV